MPRVTYTDEEKARALELLETESVWAAVSEIGCHHVTVYRWYAEHVRTLEKDEATEAAERAEIDALRARTQRRLLQVAAAHVDRSDAARDALDAQRYMTAAGIAIDKYRLEMGEVTARTYHEGTDDIDRRVSQLVAELESRSQASPS